MIKQYIQQALYSIRQHKLLSGVVILGTALSICLIVTITILQQVEVTSFSTENKRDRMLFMTHANLLKSDNNRWNQMGSFDLRMATHYFGQLNTAEAVTVYSLRPESLVGWVNKNSEKVMLDTKATDDIFFRVFDLTFLYGKAFDESLSEQGAKVAIVNQSTARKLFEQEDAVNRMFYLDHVPYRVIGVVKDVSPIAQNAYAQVWIPYHSKDMGRYTIGILASSTADFGKIRTECEQQAVLYTKENSPWELKLNGQPDELLISKERTRVTPDKVNIYLQRVFVFLLVLLVPAINLSSLSQSRMSFRLSEIGIRRAFGSTRFAVLMQLLNENMVLTLIGGVLGFFASLAIVGLFGSDLIMARNYAVLNTNPFIEVDMLFQFSVFLVVLAFCIALNLATCLFAAWKAGSCNIVDALNVKK